MATLSRDNRTDRTRSPRAAALVAGYEFEQTAFRGTSFYARALVRVLHDLGFETWLLTGAPAAGDRLLERLALTRQLLNPRSIDLWTRRKLFLRDWLRPTPPRAVALGPTPETLDRLDYLQWVDGCLNRPAVYDFIRMRSLRGWDPYPVPCGPCRLVMTPAPIQLRPPRGVPLVTAFHDMAPLVRADHPPDDDADEFMRRLRCVERHADAVICSSDAAHRELVAHFPALADRCTVIHLPVSLFPEELAFASDPTVERAVLARYGVESGGYFMYVGVIERKKNITRLVDAYLAVRDTLGLPLLMAGWLGFGSEDIRPALANPASGIRPLGYISQIDKLVLLRHARALLFPSLYEGFGLPPLEAMALGCPVLASNINAVAEACDDAALLVDARSVKQLADGLLRIATDEPLRALLIDRGLRRAGDLSLDRYRGQLAACLGQFAGLPQLSPAGAALAPTVDLARAAAFDDAVVARIAPAHEP